MGAPDECAPAHGFVNVTDRPRVRNFASEFHHEIRNKWRLMTFTWRTIAKNRRGSGLPMIKSQEYRANAAECAKLAMVVSDPDSKLVLAKMAEAWVRLADYLESKEPSKAADAIGPGG